MAILDLKPTHKVVTAYYRALDLFVKLCVENEGAVRAAFQDLLGHCAKKLGRVLLLEQPVKTAGSRSVKPDGEIVDQESKLLCYGLWEAKDTQDDLEAEIRAKLAAGYPTDNILFQEPCRAVLYQNGQRFYEADLTKPGQLVHVLSLFFSWKRPQFAGWESAVDEFTARVPELGNALAEIVRREYQTNAAYQKAFDGFLSLCRASLNPNLSVAAVEEMLIQHILTERIFRKVFDIGDFMQRNVIAREIENVIAALTSGSFSRDNFLQKLNHLYVAVEEAAGTIPDFGERQKFLNRVYERFFRGFCVKTADAYGIMYTPQPIVDFMIASVEHILHQEFQTSLAGTHVHIIDPFVGTGNFIVNIMKHGIPKTALPNKYREELHCNEVLLLPYYVASMNIEHAFWEATGTYEPFGGICLVDTFETAESRQGAFEFNAENTERVLRQMRAPLKVFIANPPYNAGQINENDNNKNRKYGLIDGRVRDTYSHASTAKLRSKLNDPYVKAIRYASDRLRGAGVICYVTNNSFVEDRSFDGMRRCLAQEFDLIYILDLGGDVRNNPKLSGTTHNVFGIQVGVSINLFVKLPNGGGPKRQAKIYYQAVNGEWRRGQKYDFLDEVRSIAGVTWAEVRPSERGCYNWLNTERESDFPTLLAMGSEGDKPPDAPIPLTVFQVRSPGANTGRDSVVYGFDPDRLAKHVEQAVQDYNAELDRWRRNAQPPKDRPGLLHYLDEFLDCRRVKWSEGLKRKLLRQAEAECDRSLLCEAAYRPFTRKILYYDSLLIDRPGSFGEVFPSPQARGENVVILVPGVGGRSPFWCFASNRIPSYSFVSIDATQCFPLYTYEDGGSQRQENISPQMVRHFRERYGDDQITPLDIFHYTYGVLHHPGYRARYAQELKKELPRISLLGTVEDFHAFAGVGGKLIDLHVNYEKQPEYPIQRVENPGVHLDWRVDAKMRLAKNKGTIRYNEFLTLTGIPEHAFKYKLGNRSAIEWVVDQYHIKKDKQGNVVDDPNRDEDEQYIVRLIGQVVHVSLETMRLINSLPPVPEWSAR